MRLKAPDKRKDSGWFARTASRLERVPGVLRVEARSLSGSLLIHHRPGPDWEQRLAGTGCFRLVEGPLATPAVRECAAGTFQLSDQVLQSRSGGGVDLRTLVIGVLIVLAIVQVIRGQVMVPAISLLFFAFNLAATAKNSD